MKVPFELPGVELDQIRPGDLVFCTKESFMQKLLTAVGDPWRHVAMVIEQGGELCIGEVSGANRIVSRPLPVALDFYDLVATARVTARSGSCVNDAVAWVADYLDTPQLYAWDDVLLVGLLLATRRALRVDQLDVLADALGRAAARAPRATHPSMTCSSFIYEAFNRNGPTCRLSVPISPMDSGPSTSVRAGLLPPLVEALQLDPTTRQTVFDSASLYELLADGEGIDLTRDSDKHHDLSLGAGSGRNLDEDLPLPTGGPSGHGGSVASPGQIARFARAVVDLVDEYGRSYRSPTGSEPAVDDGATPGQLDGRWVSPGDIWRSDDLDGRAYLKR